MYTPNKKLRFGASVLAATFTVTMLPTNDLSYADTGKCGSTSTINRIVTNAPYVAAGALGVAALTGNGPAWFPFIFGKPKAAPAPPAPAPAPAPAATPPAPAPAPAPVSIVTPPAPPPPAPVVNDPGAMATVAPPPAPTPAPVAVAETPLPTPVAPPMSKPVVKKPKPTTMIAPSHQTISKPKVVKKPAPKKPVHKKKKKPVRKYNPYGS
ncbi:MAG TPA: hypothetical protein VGK19_02240 [Capsulimonadaceae bacterium]|jgi:hypothetical protein